MARVLEVLTLQGRKLFHLSLEFVCNRLGVSAWPIFLHAINASSRIKEFTYIELKLLD
jgi:hypothetical protein